MVLFEQSNKACRPPASSADQKNEKRKKLTKPSLMKRGVCPGRRHHPYKGGLTEHSFRRHGEGCRALIVSHREWLTREFKALASPPVLSLDSKTELNSTSRPAEHLYLNITTAILPLGARASEREAGGERGSLGHRRTVSEWLG